MKGTKTDCPMIEECPVNIECKVKDVIPLGTHDMFMAEIVAINVSALECLEDGIDVTPEVLLEAGIIKHARDGVKILGNGELTKKLNVKANAFSASATEKIQALGGKAEVI